MKQLLLTAHAIHAGPLILVNRQYPYRESGETALVPVGETRNGWNGARPRCCPCSWKKSAAGGRSLPSAGWRSRKEQQAIWDQSVHDNGLAFTRTYVAVPGHSEHQTGLAVDLGMKGEDLDFIRPDFPYDGMAGAFRRRAAAYGFVERYPAGKETVTGIGHEPWHFRYVGVPHAAVMAENGLTLEEYLPFLQQYIHGERACVYRGGGREIALSYIPAREDGTTRIEVDSEKPYALSGDNVGGFILTEWRG